MEFKQFTSLATLPPEILFNYDELYKDLTEGLEKYQGLVVTEDGVKDAKADRAKLNNLTKAIDAKRMEIKRELTKPYDAFEKKVKILTGMINDASGAIDKQIKAFDETKREEKRTEIEIFFSDNIGDLRELLSFDRIFNAQWLNVAYKMADIQKEITATIEKITADLAVIDGLRGDFILQCKDKYLQTLDLSGALAEMKRLEESKKQLDEYEAKQKNIQQTEEEPKETIQETIKEESAPIRYVEKGELPKTIKVIFYNTTESFRHEMRALTEKYGVKYGGIE